VSTHYRHGKTVVNDMNVKKKVVGVFAIVLAIAAISAITLPVLATSNNAEQGTETTQGRARWLVPKFIH
jgi:hypothetical protein